MHIRHLSRGTGGAAFTLIELLVVISIIGILASLALVNLNQAQAKARNSVAMSDATEMAKSVDLFKAASGGKVILPHDQSSIGADHLVGASIQGTVDGMGYGVANSDGYLKPIFTGTDSISGLTYGTRITKAPSSDYTYSYAVSVWDGIGGNPPSATLAIPGSFSDDGVTTTPGCYLVQATLKRVSGSKADFFYVRNGSAGTFTNDGSGGANCKRP